MSRTSLSLSSQGSNNEDFFQASNILHTAGQEPRKYPLTSMPETRNDQLQTENDIPAPLLIMVNETNDSQSLLSLLMSPHVSLHVDLFSLLCTRVRIRSLTIVSFHCRIRPMTTPSSSPCAVIAAVNTSGRPASIITPSFA